MKVKNPRNILKYRKRGITSVRQVIYLLIAGVIIGGLGSLLAFVVRLPAAFSYIFSGILALPFLLSCFLKVSGLYFDEILLRIFRAAILNRDYRPFKTGGFKQ